MHLVNDRDKKKTSLLKRIFLGLFLIFAVFSLTGCQSTDKSESYIGTEDNISFSFEYDETSQKTNVSWKSFIQNDTIYNISLFHISFDCYLDDTKLGTRKLIYDISVTHGQTKQLNCRFTADGEVNKAVFNSWNAEYQNLWDTYKPWWIATIVIASVLAVAYLIFMIVEDLELDDIVDLVEDNLWVLLIILPGVVTSIWGSITENWVSSLIVVGGTLSVALIALLGHFVKFLVEEFSPFDVFESVGNFFGDIKDSIGERFYRKGREKGSEGEDDDSFDPSCENVADYVNDKETLMLFPVSDLKDYCRDNEIRGFSTLNKHDLVDLIVSSSNEAKDVTKTTEAKNHQPAKKSSPSKVGKITFDSIAGLDKAKEAFREKVVLPFEHPELFEKFGKKAGGGILLYGLPGTGKTMFAEAASNEVNATFIPVKCSDIKSKWYGESERKIKSIFDKAKKSSKAIIFFDEFEAIGAKRTDDGDNGNNDLVPEILAEMQGVGSSKIKSTIVIIAATNKPWAIDSAFMRPGRFDEKIYIPLPDFEARKALFRIQLKNVPLSSDINFDYLANITNGFNGADIKEVCEKLKMCAIKDSLEKGGDQMVDMEDVKKVEKDIKSSVSQEDIERLQAFEEENN
mgnify:CR=1 FL=1